MSRNPFKPGKDQYTEFGFGEGMSPDPGIDFSEGGSKSKFPIADPDRRHQLLNLAAAKRSDLHDDSVADWPKAGDQTMPEAYMCGNTDRYGANPPLIRNKKQPTFKRYVPPEPPRMERQW